MVAFLGLLLICAYTISATEQFTYAIVFIAYHRAYVPDLLFICRLTCSLFACCTRLAVFRGATPNMKRPLC